MKKVTKIGLLVIALALIVIACILIDAGAYLAWGLPAILFFIGCEAAIIGLVLIFIIATAPRQKE